MKTIFLRALEADDKEAALRAAIRDPAAARGKQRFDVDPASFASVPRSPFAYWVSEAVRRTFEKHAKLQQNYLAVRGAYTTNDFKYYRLAWEVLPRNVASSRQQTRAGRSMVLLAKGGAYSRFYADLHLVVCWADDGEEAKAFLSAYREGKGWGTDWSACLNGYDHYFRPGLTWPRRTQSGLALRAMPAGCIFADKGPAAFVANDDPGELLALLAITNSVAFRALVDLQMAFGSFEVGVIQRTSVPNLNPADRTALATLSRRAWSLKRTLDTRTETSHAFVLPGLLQTEGATLAERSQAWSGRVRAVETELAAIQEEIDARCFDLYGIDDADRRAITEGFGASGGDSSGGAEPDAEEDEEDEGDDAEEEVANAAGLAAELISWAAGVAFGRFDVRLVTGARPLPGEPEPFDPLPVASPGMLTGEDGLPLAKPPAGYPLTFPADGLLADDPGHPRDITAAVRAVFEAVFGREADHRLEEAAALLDPKAKDLRAWFAKEFFEHHLKRHSKSRRKAPILWQLAPPSAAYSVWVYAHRLTPDTLYAVQNDLAAPKLAHEERKLAALVQGAGSGPTASQRREIAAQEAVVEELRAFLDEVKRVAPLWKPNLDDGVVLTLAPLYRLFPHQKPWQRELKAAWEKLAAGDYDWAGISMHLWPERVVPKCATDRSLAIAHGIEDVFWVKETDGKWKPRSKPTRSPEEVVRERTSPAVKAALDTLRVAPAPSGGRESRSRGNLGSREAERSRGNRPPAQRTRPRNA